MPLYAGKHAICAFLRNMRNMLRSHVRYKPVSLTVETPGQIPQKQVGSFVNPPKKSPQKIHLKLNPVSVSSSSNNEVFLWSVKL